MPKKTSTPMTDQERENATFVAVTKKRSAMAACLAVIIMMMASYRHYDLRIAGAVVLVCFIIVNLVFLFARRKTHKPAAR